MFFKKFGSYLLFFLCGKAVTGYLSSWHTLRKTRSGLAHIFPKEKEIALHRFRPCNCDHVSIHVLPDHDVSPTNQCVENTLYIGNIPWEITINEVEQALKPICLVHGEITSFRVKPLPLPCKPRDIGKFHMGSAEVIYLRQEDAMKACQTIGQDKVQIATAKDVMLKTRLGGFQAKPKSESKQQSTKPSKIPSLKNAGFREQKKRHRFNQRERLHETTKAIADRIRMPRSMMTAGGGGPWNLANCETVPVQSLSWEALQRPAEAGSSGGFLPFGGEGQATGAGIGAASWVPLAVDPACPSPGAGRLHRRQRAASGAGGERSRAQRKRWQVEAFHALLRQTLPALRRRRRTAPGHLDRPPRVVDFGSGSGNLILPLAHLNPNCTFIAVDYKTEAINILLSRAAEANLNNIKGWVGRIEDFSEPFDVAISLHACGSATDLAILQSIQNNAPYIVSPCCIGKVKFAMINSEKDQVPKDKTTPDIICINKGNATSSSSSALINTGALAVTYPRSKWLGSQVSTEEYKLIAAAADWSPQWNSSPQPQHISGLSEHTQRHAENKSLLQKACKMLVETDRSEFAKEYPKPFDSRVLEIPQLRMYPKSHIIVGTPT